MLKKIEVLLSNLNNLSNIELCIYSNLIKSNSAETVKIIVSVLFNHYQQRAEFIKKLVANFAEDATALAQITFLEKLYAIQQQLNERLNSLNLNNASSAWWDTEFEITAALDDQISSTITEGKQLVSSKQLTALNNSYAALFELLKTEKAFITACQSLDVINLQKIFTHFYQQQRKHDATSERYKLLARVFETLKSFLRVENYLQINAVEMIVYAKNIFKFSKRLIKIIASVSFSEFYNGLLKKLTQGYPHITQYLSIVNTAVQHEQFQLSADDKKLLLNAPQILAQPFQRTARYGLTYSEFEKNIKSSIDAGLELPKSILSEDHLPLVSSLNNGLKRRCKKLNESLVSVDESVKNLIPVVAATNVEKSNDASTTSYNQELLPEEIIITKAKFFINDTIYENNISSPRVRAAQLQLQNIKTPIQGLNFIFKKNLRQFFFISNKNTTIFKNLSQSEYTYLARHALKKVLQSFENIHAADVKRLGRKSALPSGKMLLLPTTAAKIIAICHRAEVAADGMTWLRALVETRQLLAANYQAPVAEHRSQFQRSANTQNIYNSALDILQWEYKAQAFNYAGCAIKQAIPSVKFAKFITFNSSQTLETKWNPILKQIKTDIARVQALYSAEPSQATNKAIWLDRLNALDYLTFQLIQHARAIPLGLRNGSRLYLEILETIVKFQNLEIDKALSPNLRRKKIETIIAERQLYFKAQADRFIKQHAADFLPLGKKQHLIIEC